MSKRILNPRTIAVLAGLALISSACRIGSTDTEGRFSGLLLGETVGNKSLTGTSQHLDPEDMTYKDAEPGFHLYDFNAGDGSFSGWSYRK